MSTAHLVEPHLAGFQKDFNALRHELAKVVVGQAEEIEQVLIAAVAGGHVLIEGVPGLGKTLLVETLAEILQLRFSRIQFTPDLMPSDLLGHVRRHGNGCRPPHVRISAGADLCQSRAGRPDQPRPAEDPVGFAAGDGRRRRSMSRPRPSICRSRSSSSARRIRWRWKARFPCRSRKSTVSSSRW